MDGNGPNLHKDEERKIEDLMEGKDEGKDMIRKGLKPSIHGVKSNGSVRSRNEPSMMGLMNILIKEGDIMLEAVDPIDPGITEHNKQDGREEEIEP